MQWFFDNRETVFIKYILPIFLSLFLALGFVCGSIVRVYAIAPALIALGTIVAEEFIRGCANNLGFHAGDTLWDIFFGSDDYDNVVSQLPNEQICDNGIVFPFAYQGSWYAPNGYASDLLADANGNCTAMGANYVSYGSSPCTLMNYSASGLPSGYILKLRYSPYGTPFDKPVSDVSVYVGSGGSASFGINRTLDVSGGYPAMHYVYFYLPFGGAPNITKNITINNVTRTARQIYDDPTSRLGSIAGNYLYLHSDYNAETKPNSYDVYMNTALVDETNMQYHNPVTGTTKTITDWQYNYANMSYSLTLEDESTVAVTWGNEYCSIIENGKTYCLYYLPADFEENRPCEHEWSITDTVEATCTYPGMTTFSCTKCGETKIEKVDPLGHDWLLTERVDGEPSTATDVTYQPWTQPVLTSDTDYGTVSAGSYNSNGNAPAWRALDGQKSAGGQSWEAAQGVYPAWWQWKLPVTLKMSHLKLTNKYSGSSYVTKSVSVYSDSAHTNLIASGDFPSSSLSVLEWDFAEPVITDTLYIVCEDSHSSLTNTYVGLGEVEITAEEQTLQEGTTTSGGYDLYRCSRCGQTYKDYGDNPPGDNAGSSGFFKGLGNLIKRAISWVLDKLKSLVEGLNSITDVFKGFIEEIKGFTTGFTEFISGVIGILPAQLVTLLWFSVIAAVVLAVVSRFFR